MNVKYVLIALVALGGASLAQEDCGALGDCPVAKKVTDLNARWEAASRKATDKTPEAVRAETRRVLEFSKTCPVGSRIPATLAAVRETLDFVVASSAANAEHCPSNRTDSPDAKKMKAARTAALTNLQTLAAHASDATCAAERADCGACPTADQNITAKSCDEKKTCPIRLAARLGGLRESFATARREVAALPQAQRREILAGFGEIAKSNGTVALVPESVDVLCQGLTALDGLHDEMVAWAEARPGFMVGVPAATRIAMRTELALIDEARALLADAVAVKSAFKAQTTKVVAR